jgi:nucleotide-binding universal stress UspA family protein
MAPTSARDGFAAGWRAAPAWPSLGESDKEGLVTGSIICGVDDSESAKGAVRVARELSARLRLRLVFVRVVEEGTHDGDIAAIAARLHHLADAALEADAGAHWLVDVGHPADRLVAAAEEESAVLLVVGSTGPRSSLLGSISADVSRRAPCPVVVVAPGADRPFANGALAHELSRDPMHDGYEGTSGSIRLGSDGKRDDRVFAGGVVRMNLGGGGRS